MNFWPGIGNPQIKILNRFLLFSAFVMRISYFRVYKFQKVPSKCNFFRLLISSINIIFGCRRLYLSRRLYIGIFKTPEFYAEFRYEGIIQKKYTEKDNPEKLFLGNFLLSAQKNCFFGLTLLRAFFLNNFFSLETSRKFWICRHPDCSISREKSFALEKGFSPARKDFYSHNFQYTELT
jgi:hypothetical protein